MCSFALFNFSSGVWSAGFVSATGGATCSGLRWDDLVGEAAERRLASVALFLLFVVFIVIAS
jgi:hypothetical protein